MVYRTRRDSWISMLPILLILACTIPSTSPSPVEQKQNIKQLILEVRRNPRSSTAFRDLGSALFEMKLYKYAVKSLLKAYRLNKHDAQTLYYLAQLLEIKNQTDRAIQIYSRYALAKTPVEYEQKMEARYQLLNRQKMRGDIQRLMQSEALLEIKAPSSKAVGVMPLKYMGLDDQYAPMGKGVAEMMMTDLSQIKQLDVVERIRMQALLDEMNLSQTGLMDVTSTPKMGKLLGAGKIVQGNFAVLNDRDFHLDVIYTDINANTIPSPVTMKDNLNEVFKLEKDLVFKVIDQMGIALTPEEKQRIQHIPTKSIQAFMAYCMGLEMEDQGDFAKASEYYQKAVQLDPEYEEARNKSAVNQNMAQMSTTTIYDHARRKPVSPQMPLAPNMISRETLIHNRLQTTNRNIGSTFIPAQDSRKSSQEFIATEVSEALGERLTVPIDLSEINAESIFRTVILPDLPIPPEPPPGP